MGAEASLFYQRHRGGQGAVVVATAIHGEDGDERTGIFSCIETAQAWSDALGERWACVFCPYIVDDPDWGNEASE